MTGADYGLNFNKYTFCFFAKNVKVSDTITKLNDGKVRTGCLKGRKGLKLFEQNFNFTEGPN